MEQELSRIGLGLYTVAEASHLLGLPPARLRRWLGGYRARREYEPLWTPQLPRIGDHLGLGFLDLMQARVVAEIVTRTDISLQTVRKALLAAQELTRHDHPFTTAAFRTDGHKIFLEVGQGDEPQLYDVLGRQFQFHRIVAPSFKDVDLDVAMTRWWPLGRRRTVVLDPRRSFGAPIAAQSGIPTATLAMAADNEGSVREVTRWYPASEREVRDAVDFERRLAGPPVHQMAA